MPEIAPVGFEIGDDDFEAIRRLVREAAGITLNDSKRALVVARLSKRLRHYGYRSFGEYEKHLRDRDADGSELRELINCITTNKTEFFREAHHFEWLRRELIPQLKARAQVTGTKKLRIWSAGCSTGQEPYSIAMVLAEELGHGGWDLRILASDIDTHVLEKAIAGEYDEDVTEDVPVALRNKFFERKGSRLVVARSVRDLVTFRRVNLIEKNWPIRIRFDTIFCRNVTIYFDRETQERLYERFVAQLEPHGYFVAGHSENLHWLSALLTPIGATVYRPAGAAPRAESRRPTMAPRARIATRRPPPKLSRRPVRASVRPPRASHRPIVSEVPIKSGEIFISAEPTIVRTVLGSCVAACVFDPESHVGGMNHFMLPAGSGADWGPNRYGSHAMKALVSGLLKEGADRARLRAKIFGGAHVLRYASASRAIPDDNVAFVRAFLAAERIPIISERVGGDLPLIVRFESHTGRAFIRSVETNDADVIARHEARFREELTVVVRESAGAIKIDRGIA